MKIIQKVIIAMIVMVAISLNLNAQQKTYFPDKNEWQSQSPDNLKINAEKLAIAIDFAKKHESPADTNLKIAHYESAFGREPFGYPIGPMKNRGEASGLVIKNGYIVAQWGTPERVDLTFSVAKSMVSANVGLAFDRGLIKSENDLVYPYMAPIIPYEPMQAQRNKADHLYEEDVIELFDNEHNRKITWDHLLRQTSDWEGVLWGKPDWADRPSRDAKDWRTRERNEPGTVYKYNDTRENVLALASMNVWRRPLPVVLKDHMVLESLN